MTCMQAALTLESCEEPVLGAATVGAATGADVGPKSSIRGRRHSSYHPPRSSSNSMEGDFLLLKVDLFLSKLERRLTFLESYGNLHLDAGISRAHATLQAVRSSCSHVSDELLGEGRRRAKVLVDTLERHYDAMAPRETMEQNIQAGIKLMEDLLADFESRAHAIREAGLGGMVHEGRRRVDEGLGRAREAVDEGMERAWRAKENLKESIEQAINRAREHGLIKYEDLPHPWRVNPHILRGYRFTESKVECIWSVLRFSNETVNIWSHAIGLVVVLAIAFHFYPTSVNFPLSTTTDVFMSAFFFFAACKCLVCSTMWHTMNGIAEQTLLERFACVDYTGISLLIAASIMTTEYTAFYCEPLSRWFYICTTAALGIGGVILPWYPIFNRSDMQWARVAFYVTLGATGLVPVIQLNWTRGPKWTYFFYAPVMKSVAVYLIGALVYASQVPERWWPGGFDYVGGSHNLWHLAVLGGILFHYSAMQDFFAGAFTRAHQDCAIR